MQTDTNRGKKEGGEPPNKSAEGGEGLTPLSHTSGESRSKGRELGRMVKEGGEGSGVGLRNGPKIVKRRLIGGNRKQ